MDVRTTHLNEIKRARTETECCGPCRAIQVSLARHDLMRAERLCFIAAAHMLMWGVVITAVALSDYRPTWVLVGALAAGILSGHAVVHWFRCNNTFKAAERALAAEES